MKTAANNKIFSRDDFTEAMKSDDRVDLINEMLGSTKPGRGCYISFPEFCGEQLWGELRLPQWVKLSDKPGPDKVYRFDCDEEGHFIRWSL